jgi:hypothetical protein
MMNNRCNILKINLLYLLKNTANHLTNTMSNFFLKKISFLILVLTASLLSAQNCGAPDDLPNAAESEALIECDEKGNLDSRCACFTAFLAAHPKGAGADYARCMQQQCGGKKAKDFECSEKNIPRLIAAQGIYNEENNRQLKTCLNSLDHAAWQKANTPLPTNAGINHYLTTFTMSGYKGRHVEEATTMLRLLEHICDESMWEDDIYGPSRLRLYIANCSSKGHYEEAKKRLEDIEEGMWRNTERLRTQEAVNVFSQNFPNSAHNPQLAEIKRNLNPTPTKTDTKIIVMTPTTPITKEKRPIEIKNPKQIGAGTTRIEVEKDVTLVNDNPNVLIKPVPNQANTYDITRITGDSTANVTLQQGKEMVNIPINPKSLAFAQMDTIKLDDEYNILVKNGDENPFYRIDFEAPDGNGAPQTGLSNIKYPLFIAELSGMSGEYDVVVRKGGSAKKIGVINVRPYGMWIIIGLGTLLLGLGIYFWPKLNKRINERKTILQDS